MNMKFTELMEMAFLCGYSKGMLENDPIDDNCRDWIKTQAIMDVLYDKWHEADECKIDSWISSKATFKEFMRNLEKGKNLENNSFDAEFNNVYKKISHFLTDEVLNTFIHYPFYMGQLNKLFSCITFRMIANLCNLLCLDSLPGDISTWSASVNSDYKILRDIVFDIAKVGHGDSFSQSLMEALPKSAFVIDHDDHDDNDPNAPTINALYADKAKQWIKKINKFRSATGLPVVDTAELMHDCNIRKLTNVM